MTELQNILQDSLINDKSVVVIVDANVQMTQLTIHDSRTMFLYGLGRQDSHGFVLRISVDKNSNKGKEVIAKLSKDNFLLGFSLTEEKVSMIYLKDFGTNIEEIQSHLNSVLEGLKQYRPSNKVDFIVRDTKSLTS